MLVYLAMGHASMPLELLEGWTWLHTCHNRLTQPLSGCNHVVHLQDLSGFDNVEEALAAHRTHSQSAASSSPRSSIPAYRAGDSSSNHGSPTAHGRAAASSSESPRSKAGEPHEGLLMDWSHAQIVKLHGTPCSRLTAGASIP